MADHLPVRGTYILMLPIPDPVRYGRTPRTRLSRISLRIRGTACFKCSAASLGDSGASSSFFGMGRTLPDAVACALVLSSPRPCPTPTRSHPGPRAGSPPWWHLVPSSFPASAEFLDPDRR